MDNSLDKDTIIEKYSQAKEKTQGLRIRDYAEIIGVSEMELLIANPENHYVRKITTDSVNILTELHQLDEVMALTRNSSAVLEATGNYPNIEEGHAGAIGVGSPIDVRLFTKKWEYCFLTERPKDNGMLRSIQFFDKSGTAVHKVYLRDKSNFNFYESLKTRFAEEINQIPNVEAKEEKSFKKLSDEEVLDFNKEWTELEDTHDFSRLLRKYNVRRIDALRNAPEDLSYKVYNSSVIDLLYNVSDKEIPIILFVPNDAAVQLYSGTVKNIRLIENWTNIIDDKLNLHLRNDMITESRVVKKPTKNGIITSLELYDSDLETALYIYGVREENSKESEQWRKAVLSLDKY